MLPPVPGAVVRGFDPPTVRWGAGHRGVDLAAQAGDAVHAPAAGVVTFAGPVAGRGVLTLRHDDGLLSSFEPVSAVVHVGERVDQGDVVATLDRPGGVAGSADTGGAADASGAVGAGSAVGHCAPASCLHWGVRRGETYLDPMALVADDPIVLLPPEPA